jgi:hypothetical protein
MRLVLALAAALLPAALQIASPAAMAAPVGYVNILNGADPAKAFVIKRGADAISPEGVYTDLEAGDLVEPQEGAMLLFTPLDAACAPLEIDGVFEAAPCPSQGGDFGDAAYDFLANRYLAAPEQEVGLMVTRGEEEEDKRLWSLPPIPPLVFVESQDLAAELARVPFLALTSDREAAEITILGEGVVSLALAGREPGPPVDWRADLAGFRGALWRRLNYLAMAGLSSPGPWPELRWTVNIYAPDDDGELEHGGRFWALAGTTVLEGEPAAPVSLGRPSLLTFELANNSLATYYAYLLNYTDQGQILPVLPPEAKSAVRNRVDPGQTLDLGQIRLELGAPVEAVRLIISEKPLDLARFSQDGLDAPSEARPGLLRPVPESAWRTTAQLFELK